MAERETKNNPKDLIEATPEELSKLKPIPEAILAPARSRPYSRDKEDMRASLDSWAPKTELGRLVKAGKEKDIDKLLVSGKKILEPEIVDSLLSVDYDLLAIGQAKGKFGGGKRRAWRQTQKKTMEGNVLTFSCMAVVGDKKGHVGIGYGRSKETLPSRAKAVRKAKLNVIKITRGFESPNDTIREPHTVPFVVEGKCGSVRIKLIPAPRGTGLVIGDQGKKILKLAGIQDVYAVTKGQTRTTFNVAKACIDALQKTSRMIL
ncbi:30S ribosomal protein S5 [Candidatus Pacearchaeota archaeon]|nr:30S ribosomal protein S5 [Candidatus Pacearchaeota archaeon]